MVAKPLETVMPTHTLAWYLDLHWCLLWHVLRAGPGGLELGLYGTLSLPCLLI